MSGSTQAFLSDHRKNCRKRLNSVTEATSVWKGVSVDLASLVGLVGAFGIVIFAMILGGDITMFVNVPSLLIVIVGSLFAVMMKFELGQFLAAGKVAGKAFAFKLIKPEDLIGEIVELAGLARIKRLGGLALQGFEFGANLVAQALKPILRARGMAGPVSHAIPLAR